MRVTLACTHLCSDTGRLSGSVDWLRTQCWVVLIEDY